MGNEWKKTGNVLTSFAHISRLVDFEDIYEEYFPRGV